MVDIELVRNKLGQLAEYMLDLQEVQSTSAEEFRADKMKRRFIERTLHLALEWCLDIGNHIIADHGWREPLNNRDIFMVLMENGVIDRKALPNLQKMAQFRNVLVHDYARVDPEIVYQVLKEGLSDIRAYMQAIYRLL